MFSRYAKHRTRAIIFFVSGVKDDDRAWNLGSRDWIEGNKESVWVILWKSTDANKWCLWEGIREDKQEGETNDIQVKIFGSLRRCTGTVEKGRSEQLYE
jgi:hypothetical protein